MRTQILHAFVLTIRSIYICPNGELVNTVGQPRRQPSGQAASCTWIIVIHAPDKRRDEQQWNQMET